jgi:hypothetical protein
MKSAQIIQDKQANNKIKNNNFAGKLNKHQYGVDSSEIGIIIAHP